MVSLRSLGLSLLLLAALGAAEVRFEPQGAVRADSRLQAQVVVENAASPGAALELPDAPGIAWLGHRRTRTQHSIVNGVASHTEVWTVIADLDGSERWELPPIVVRLGDGSELRTEPLALEPTPVVEELRGEYHAAVSFDPPAVVPGQTTELVYHLFLLDPRGIQLDEGIGVQLPADAIPQGESRVTGQTTVFGPMGDEWTRVEIRWPLVMTAPGSYEVGGQQGLKQLVRDRMGFDRGYRSVATIPIRPGTLTVTTLPQEGRPEDFAGLIGEVRIEAALERSTIALGEGTGYTVTVHGHQLELLGKLPPPRMAGLRARLVDDEAVGTTAHRWRYNLQPERVGSFSVPAPDIAWFDPATRSYRRARGPVHELEVLPGRQRELAIAGSLAPGEAAAPDRQRPGLPPPLRGAGLAHAPLSWGWALLAIGALLGLAAGLGQRLLSRTRRGPRLGDDLGAAIAADDLAAIDRLLHRARALDAGPRAEVEALIVATERARFGGGGLDDPLVARLRALREQLP